jgi:bacteriocin-like protein
MRELSDEEMKQVSGGASGGAPPKVPKVPPKYGIPGSAFYGLAPAYGARDSSTDGTGPGNGNGQQLTPPP